MSNEIISIRDGVCPYCESERIDWLDSELDCDAYRYDCECKDCKRAFTVWYTLEFDGITDDNDKFISANKDVVKQALLDIIWRNYGEREHNSCYDIDLLTDTIYKSMKGE